MDRGKYRLPFSPDDEIYRMVSPGHQRKGGGGIWCIDFYMPEGTPVRAARSGVVIQRESRYNSHHRDQRRMRECNVVYIEHDDYTCTVYAHLAWRSVYPSVGERVRTGQIIGRSGWTGYASCPHLHFGLYDEDNRNVRINWSDDARSRMPAY